MLASGSQKRIDSYNKSTGALEHGVLPSARRLRDLRVSSPEGEVTAPKAIEITPRMLQADELVERNQAHDV